MCFVFLAGTSRLWPQSEPTATPSLGRMLLTQLWMNFNGCDVEFSRWVAFLAKRVALVGRKVCSTMSVE